MDKESSPYYFSGFEYTVRKGRGKKKRKPRTNKNVAASNDEIKSESETSNTMEQIESVDPELTDGDETVVEDEKEDFNAYNKENLSLKLNEKGISREVSRVSLDAMLVSPPSYEEEDKVKIIGNELELNESVVDKVNIEDDPIYAQSGDPEEKCTVINTRALPKEASTYQLENFERNALIIFNQEKIDGHQPRLGTDKDVEALTRTFENFGFEVTTHHDLTKDEVFRELKTFSERDFTEYGCVAVAVLTHGSHNGLLRAKDQQYSEIEIINQFKDYNKPTLVTKPKIIIIQACRGTKIMQGVPVFHAGKIRRDLDEDLEPYILPVESDLLILHSSYVGSPSHRNELYGSWFIQALCNKIDSLASTLDFESIITEVKREVAIDKQHEEYNKRTFEMDINKQMPVMTSTLIRKLYLKKFGETSETETFVDTLRKGSDSKHEVLDMVNSSAPVTPLLVQFGPCSCFLDHFNYMKSCLRYFIEENPHDETAQNFLAVANTFEDGVEFNTSKETMTKAISKHLFNNARSCQYFKYLYFYKHTQPQLFK